MFILFDSIIPLEIQLKETILNMGMRHDREGESESIGYTVWNYL
jgi:hypothetical protein